MNSDQGSISPLIPDAPVVRLLFSVLWNELRDTIGSAPTAALLRRAIAMTRDTCPALMEISITKDGRDYRYDVPQSLDSNPSVCGNLGQFLENVFALLRELTGNVLVRHLLGNPLIRKFSNQV